MVGAIKRFSLGLLGPFRLTRPEGERVLIPSKKGVALVALLAMARDGERTRSWLQDKLWGKRQHNEGRGSLRRELSNLRRLLNRHPGELLICEQDRVRLRLDVVDLDVRREPDKAANSEFLEGLDIVGEEGFEEWLREQRNTLTRRTRDRREMTFRVNLRPDGPSSAPQLPAHIVDTSQPPTGFEGCSALAVMPFVNMTGDAQYDYLAEGVSEELIDRLSRLRWLPVIARNSSFSFPEGTDRDLVSKSLGARYLLEGRVRRGIDAYLIAASLVDASTGHTVWTQRFELQSLTLKDSFGQFVTELVAHLEARIDHAEQVRTRSKRRDDLSVSELIWRGRWHLNRLTRTDSDVAQRLFAEAREIDPHSSEALIQSIFAMGWEIWAERQSEQRILQMRKVAQEAIYVDRDDGRGYMLAGIAEMWLRHPIAARDLLQHAIALNPSLALARAHLGGSFNLSAEPEQALSHLQAALRLNSNDLHDFYTLAELALTFTLLGRWSDAIEHAHHAIARRPAYWYAHMIRINAMSRAGEPENARHALKELLRVKPDFSRHYIEWLPFVDRNWNDHFVDGLMRVPESPLDRLARDGQGATA